MPKYSEHLYNIYRILQIFLVLNLGFGTFEFVSDLVLRISNS
jgi:hypothetical protein